MNDEKHPPNDDEEDSIQRETQANNLSIMSSSSQFINSRLKFSSQTNSINYDQNSTTVNSINYSNDHQQHSNTAGSFFSSSNLTLNQQTSVNQSNHNYNRKIIKKSSHKRTRSVDLRLTNSTSSSSLLSSQSSAPISATNQSSKSNNFIIKIEEKVSKLYYKHGLFCSRHPALIISFSLLIVMITSYQIFTFRGVFGSSYDVYISSSTKSHDDFILMNGDHDANSVHPLMKHFNYWPDSYIRNELDDQNVPPWFQSNLSYAHVQQIYIRSAVIPWPQDMQLVDALRAPFETIFEIIEAVSNFQYKNEYNESITLNDICFQVFEPTFSARYSHLSSHLPSYSCLTLSPANIWHGDRTNFLQDQNFLSTLLKFQDLTTSPIPSGAMHDIIFGVPFEDTGIRRTYGRNRVRTISYSITLILRRNYPEFIDSLRTYLHKRYPLSTNILLSKTTNEQQQQPSNRNQYETESQHHQQQPQQTMNNVFLDNKTKHVYFHKTFTYNYLIPLIIIYTMACIYMYYIVRKVEIIYNKRLYSLCTMITLIMSLLLSFGICFRLRFHSVLIVNRLLPYFVAGISFENMLVLTKSVLVNPHLDSKVRVAQALSKEGLSITKNLLAELALLSIGSFTFMPFFQECCKIAAVCFLSDFFIQLTFFTPFHSLLVQRIERRNIKSYPEKHTPRTIYARPGEPVQHKTPKRLRLILFLARLRLVQRGFILLLSACIGLAIYNTYLVLEQSYSMNSVIISSQQQTILSSNKSLNDDSMLSRINESEINPNFEMNQMEKSTSPYTITDDDANDNDEIFNSNDTLISTFDSNKQKSFIQLLNKYASNDEDKNFKESKINHKQSRSSSSSSTTINNPYYRISYIDSIPESFSNQHWTNLFSLYNISLIGRFITILPPILLSVPVTPDRAKRCRNVADSDYHTLKKFIPMKFSNGEYVIGDDDDFDKFDEQQQQQWSRNDLRLIIGLWTPCFVLFIYLIIQLYRCICTRNYAEWRSKLSGKNPLVHLGTFIKRTASSQNPFYDNNQERLLRIDISILNHDHQKEIFENKKHRSINNQDIDLIVTNTQTSLVATSSLSGDLRIYDSLTCELLTTIKRSNFMTIESSSSIFPYEPSSIVMNDESNDEKKSDCDNKNPVLIKTEGNILKTLFYEIQNDDNDIANHEDNDYDVDNMLNINQNYNLKNLDFRSIWCLDIYDKYILIGCGGDDGRLEIWDSYTGQLSFVYYSDEYKRDDNNSKMEKSNNSHAITTLKSTYWAVALARLNGQIEILELEQFKEDKYSIIFQPNASSSSSSSPLQTRCSDQISYRLKFRVQAHKQPITRMEIIDSLEDDEFIKVFGSRGCLISGSMDTTLKVYALDNFKLMYTLNGHCGSIVTTAIDPYSTANALSGCQLGQMCVWDLNTGSCIFSMQAHFEAEILSIVTSQLYYVTTGTDNTICIWDRYSGHLIHRIFNQHTMCRNMVFLEPYILVTARDNELIIWDCNDARSICIVPLSSHTNEMLMDTSSLSSSPNYNANNDNQNIDDNNNNGNDQNNSENINNNSNNKWIKSFQTSSIKNLLFSYEQKSLICDYGNLLCIINNPFAMKKND